MTETQKITERILEKYELGRLQEEKPLLWPELSYAEAALRFGAVLLALLVILAVSWALTVMVTIAF